MKKQRGGQQGNQNARKHGVYSSMLSSPEKDQVNDMVAGQNLAPQEALLIVKLRNILENDRDNRRALAEISRSITDWYSAKFDLSRYDNKLLKIQIDSLMDNLVEIYAKRSQLNAEKRLEPCETDCACFYR